MAIDTSTTRRCYGCNLRLPLTEFHRHKGKPLGLAYSCRSCTKIRNAAWYSENHAHAATYRRHKNYKLRVGAIEAMLEEQDHRCAACTEPITLETSRVDHDHGCCPGRVTCGRCVRALLCDPCNQMLGNAKDDIRRLEAGIAYLLRVQGGV